MSFQFTASCEADLNTIKRKKRLRIFQFTASCEADPSLEVNMTGNVHFSIHSLMRGWPVSSKLYRGNRGIFNSQPHARLTRDYQPDSHQPELFNSQPHARLTELNIFISFSLVTFQFTASCEADLSQPLQFRLLSLFNSQPHARLTGCVIFDAMPVFTFQFTASCEADPDPWALCVADAFFQFTASCEADHTDPTMSPFQLVFFNSQPHARLTFSRLRLIVLNMNFQFTASCEADPGESTTSSGVENFSIHSLMRGWPSLFFWSHVNHRFSIHSLMRGWPVEKCDENNAELLFNSQPHARLTLSQPLQFRLLSLFNSQPHARLTSKNS